MRKANTFIKVIFIAEGTSCRFGNGNELNATINSEIEIRNKYGIDALAYLGVPEHSFYNLPCGRLDSVPIITINKIIEGEIAEFKPDTVFTHSRNDANNDHKIVFKSTIMATRPLANSTVRTVLSYEVNSSTEWNFGSESFHPNYFVQLEKQHVQDKIAALNYYQSEIKPYPFPRSGNGIEVTAKNRGMQTGVEFAEAFIMLRSII
jgi:LmbE family N-acetylglucosaminyl deacetylase